MSTHADKVTATYDFLVNRASQGARLTNHREVGEVIGKLLNERHQRRISTPVARAKVIKALKDVDNRSLNEKGVMLSALVTHFWDDRPSRRFFESAIQRGVYAGGDNESFHKAQLAQIAQAYPTLVGVNAVKPTAPKHAAVELDDDYDEDEVFEDEDETVVSESRLRQLIREEVSKIKASF